MTIHFVSRATTVVTVSDGVYTRQINFTFEPQAHLYEIYLTDQLSGSDRNFAVSLAYAKNPSSKQLYWVDRMIAKATGTPVVSNYTAEAPTPSMVNYDISKIMDMFNHAKQHLKRPKITLRGDQGHRFRFTMHNRDNCIYVYDATAYGVTYARLEFNGEIFLRRHGQAVRQELDAIIREFAADPQATAIKHGKLTGNCCFCQLPLSDSRSLNAGYGEICAGHYKLPWGAKPNMSAEANWVVGDKA